MWRNEAMEPNRAAISDPGGGIKQQLLQASYWLLATKNNKHSTTEINSKTLCLQGNRTRFALFLLSLEDYISMVTYRNIGCFMVNDSFFLKKRNLKLRV